MSVDPVDYLRRLDLATLESLCGQTVVLAVRSQFRTNVERELAKILKLKIGPRLFEVPDVRMAVLDSLSSDQSGRLCKEVGISASSDVRSRIKLSKYFRSYNKRKSQQLVSFLELSDDYLFAESADSRAQSELISIKYGEQAKLKSYLHPFQKRVKNSIVRRLNSDGAKFIVQMPTGAGKTYTALEAVVDHLRSPDWSGFVVWIVSSNELAEQAFDTFVDLWKLKGDRQIRAFRLFADFQPNFEKYREGMIFAGFAKVNSILTNRDHSAYQSIRWMIRQTQLLIVDEAHTSMADTYEQCINAFASNDVTDIVGLTATPGRTDPVESLELRRLYSSQLIGVTDDDGNLVQDPIGYLQKNGYLARLSYETFETGLTFEESERHINRALACSEERNKKILEQMSRAIDLGHTTLVFSCTKDHAYALYVLCKSQEIDAEVITGDVPQAERLEILDRFRRKEFLILINQNILSTGIDVPNIERIIVTPPIGSKILYSQILGRALRGPKNGGNEENTVVGIRDNLLSFPSAQLIYESFANEWGDG